VTGRINRQKLKKSVGFRTRFRSALGALSICWLSIVAAQSQDSAPQQAPTPFPVPGQEIALVFDDGPIPGLTNKILDALKTAGMHASFSVVGRNVEDNPQLAKRIVAEGHELVNQTYSRCDANHASQAEFLNDVMLGQQTIEKLTGVRPRYFRAPNNVMYADLRVLLEAGSYTILEPTLDSGDWRSPRAGVVRRTILKGVKPGSVILAHDSFPKSVAEMPSIIAELSRLGFRSLTISELRECAPREGVIPDSLPVTE